MSPSNAASSDLGRLVLRVSVAGMLLLHGLAKVRHGVGGLEAMLHAKGLPPVLAYGAYAGEVLAPVLVILGVWTRPAAVIMLVNMLVAVALAHGQSVLSLGPQGGWAIELPMLYAFGALAIALLGAGGYSATRGRGRFD